MTKKREANKVVFHRELQEENTRQHWQAREDIVKKQDKISADVGNFLHLLESAKQFFFLFISFFIIIIKKKRRKKCFKKKRK
ncbi:hypothetical protein IEQ34_007911 [Dendrobium chrysotoxum]|uniref:Uncharacterized protein n=1 Tax=Dendrobium chrysotoxum TaxID=161865 RepID=A0AAV7H5E9_DENCH|nr:hypothetical protein IEQ34_007911 [Dendrobium chrysotoxum]